MQQRGLGSSYKLFSYFFFFFSFFFFLNLLFSVRIFYLSQEMPPPLLIAFKVTKDMSLKSIPTFSLPPLRGFPPRVVYSQTFF